MILAFQNLLRFLVNELRSLCIDLELIDDTKKKAMEVTDSIGDN